MGRSRIVLSLKSELLTELRTAARAVELDPRGYVEQTIEADLATRRLRTMAPTPPPDPTARELRKREQHTELREAPVHLSHLPTR